MSMRPMNPSHPRWPLVVEAAALARDGHSSEAIGRIMGHPGATIREWLRRHRAHVSDHPETSLDPAIRTSMDAIGTGMVPSLVWVKEKNPEGISHSVLLKPQPVPDDTLARIRAAFDGATPAKPVAPPESTMGDYMTLYPIMDAHIGMLAWSKETGDVDYDLAIARQDLDRASAKLLALTPPSSEAILVVGGDYFHIDDNRNETPQSKNRLDVDGRYFKVLDVGVDLLKMVVLRLLEKHGKLTVKVLRGNHDEHSHIVLTVALREWLRAEPRATVEFDARIDLYMRQWGSSAVFVHHGDKRWTQPGIAVSVLSDVCPFWSATRHRHLFTGHYHKDSFRDLGSLRIEGLRPFCPLDAYASGMGYVGRRALQAITFHVEDGIVMRTADPVDRNNKVEETP